MKIDTQPHIILCHNELPVNNQGGHLQGVQLLEKGDTEYAILSGSSGTYAYYSVVHLGNYKRVLSVNVLMHSPFKHAGGIQIYQNLMVVGIEDNALKDKSRICIYGIENPEQPPAEPLALIEREGEPLRSTAGCCGITRIRDRYLVVAGDWDTRHLDFYLSGEHRTKQHPTAFEKVCMMDLEKIDKSGWPDKEWHAYQNINLLKDADGKLYLFGFGQNIRHENIADMFLVEDDNLEEFRLKKLLSKKFNCSQGAEFRSGAGICLQADGELKVICCGPHMNDSLILNIFE